MPPHPSIKGEPTIIGQQYGKTKLKSIGSVVLVSETAPLPNQRGGVFIEKEPNQIVLPSAFMLAAIAEARKKWRSFIQSSRSYGPVS